MAAEVARDVRYDVRAGTLALKALRMIVSLAMRDGKTNATRSVAFDDIVAAFVHASMDGVVAVPPPDGLLERDALRHSNGLKAVAAAPHESAQRESVGERAQRWPGFSTTKTPLARVDATDTVSWLKLLTSQDKITTTELEAKLLGRAGRRHLSEIEFFKAHLCAGTRMSCASAGVAAHATSKNLRRCLGTRATEP